MVELRPILLSPEFPFSQSFDTLSFVLLEGDLLCFDLIPPMFLVPLPPKNCEGILLLIRCGLNPSPIRFHFIIGGGFNFLQTINAEVKEMKLRSYTILM